MVIASYARILTILFAILHAWSLMKWLECGADESRICLASPISDFYLFGRLKEHYLEKTQWQL
jgi:hypothetical protein